MSTTQRIPATLGRSGRGTLPQRALIAATAAFCTMLAAGCSASAPDPVAKAQAQVEASQKALDDAKTSATAASATFCSASSDYITALDRYGDILVDSAPTVGDVRAGGKDLAQPRDDTMKAATASVDAQQSVVKAEQDLADAQTALAAAQAQAASKTPPPPSAAPTPSPSVPPASVDRVKQAEQDFSDTQAGITDQTPLRQAAEQFNAAAVALEMSWLRLFADTGCLTDAQQKQAGDTVSDYTKTLQQALTDLGHYKGKVDGVYGPQTVDAVQSLQKAHGLPETGTVDRATALAIQADLAAKSGSTSLKDGAATAAVQQTLKLAGYWDGPVDGVWTDDLTSALKKFQTDLGVPATGAVDAATIAAFQEALEDAQTRPTPTKTVTVTATTKPTATVTTTTKALPTTSATP